MTADAELIYARLRRSDSTFGERLDDEFSLDFRELFRGVQSLPAGIVCVAALAVDKGERNLFVVA